MAQPKIFDDGVQVHMYMERSDRDRFQHLARRLNMPFSVFVRQACEMHAEELELKVGAMDVKRRRADRLRKLEESAAS